MHNEVYGGRGKAVSYLLRHVLRLAMFSCSLVSLHQASVASVALSRCCKH
jgi:hypothetical protein